MRLSDGQRETYTWDHRNRLTAVTTTTAGGATIETLAYEYDGFDRLVSRTHDSDGAGPLAATREVEVWDRSHLALVLDGQGGVTEGFFGARRSTSFSPRKQSIPPPVNPPPLLGR